MIENMNRAESKQRITNTLHTCHKGRLVPHKKVPTAVSILPMAVATKLKSLHLPTDQIKAATGLSEEDIEKL